MTRTPARLLVIAIVLAAPAAALAQPSPRISAACDGYGAFDKKTDGLTVGRALFGGPRVDQAASTLRVDARFGESGVKACDAALSILPEAHWARKVSLLRSRAIHRIYLGEFDAALADLDLAGAAAQAPNDPYFRRSLGVGNDYLRAFALRRLGKRDEATALAVKAWEERPYNRPSAYAALAAMGDQADPQQVDKVLRGVALLNPVVVDELFWRAMQARRFEEAIALYAVLSPPEDFGDEPMTDPQRHILAFRNRLDATEFWARDTAAYAYALAATGKAEEARATIAGARKRFDAELAATASETDASIVVIRDNRLPEMRAAADEGLELWEKLIDRRQMAQDKPVELLISLQSDLIANTPIAIDVIDTLLKNLPADYQVAAPALNGLKAQLAEGRGEDAKKDFERLYDDLPDPESPSRITAYGKKANFWTGDVDRYRIDARPGGATVIYRGVTASRAMVEELALLHAADEALKAGRKGLIVTGRKDYQHTLTTSYYGISSEAMHNGFDTRLDIIYVDPQALPAGYEKAGWRVIDAAKVYRELGPIYGAPVQVSER